MSFVPELESPEYYEDPYPTLAVLRDHGPVYRRATGNEYLILSHAEIRDLGHAPLLTAVMRDTRWRGPKRLRDLVARLHGPILNLSRYNMAQNDPPVHTRLRHQATRAFTTRLMEKMRTRIHEVAEEFLDRVIDRGEMDLLGDFARPMVTVVIMELLGIPEKDRDMVNGWSREIVAFMGELYRDPSDVAFRGAASATAIWHYATELIDEKRRRPENDFMSELVQVQQQEDGRITKREVVGQTALILIAGQETTPHLIANGMHALLRNPEQMARLRADPSLMKTALDEMLRYDGPIMQFPRWTTGELQLAGMTIPPEAKLMIMFGAGNRDPARYEDPDRFDITRDAHDHVAFGFDRHMCLGRHLARVEGEVAFGMLLDRLPRLRLADPDKLEHHRNFNLRQFKALPVVF
jgi:cytochrome P450 PksS